jgi:cation/acetate symporter
VGTLLGALVAAGAFAAFLSTSSGLLISMAGALAHDIMGGGVRTFRLSAALLGLGATALGLFVAAIPINVLVGWAFAIAASSFCPLLLLGIWWRRLTWIGALCGLALGRRRLVCGCDRHDARCGHHRMVCRTPERAGHLVCAVGIPHDDRVSLMTPHAVPAGVTRKLLALHLPERIRIPDHSIGGIGRIRERISSA